MRDQDEPDELREPQPGLAQLGALIDSVRSAGLPVTLQVDGELPPDSAAVGPSVYRIVQESLTNVVKHARAHSVSVVLNRGDGRIKAVIEDDGTGFAPETVGEGGIGLVGMRERIELLDGSLTVESSERSGTTVAVEVPVR
jgi:signal transduction histidine kinase